MAAGIGHPVTFLFSAYQLFWVGSGICDCWLLLREGSERSIETAVKEWINCISFPFIISYVSLLTFSDLIANQNLPSPRQVDRFGSTLKLTSQAEASDLINGSVRFYFTEKALIKACCISHLARKVCPSWNGVYQNEFCQRKQNWPGHLETSESDAFIIYYMMHSLASSHC